MFNSLPASIFSIYSGIVLASVTACVIGSGVYDTKELKKQQDIKTHPYSKKYRHRPLITVIIPSFNNAKVIERSLLSICQSSYRNYEVIIVDNLSTDDTKEVVGNFKNLHPKVPLRFLAKRKKGNRLSVIQAGQRWANGELVIILEPDCYLEREALMRVRTHFACSNVAILLPYIQPIPALSLSGLYQQFEQSMYLTSYKFMDTLHLSQPRQFINVIFRAHVLKDTIKAKSYLIARQTSFASDVIVNTPGAKSFAQIFWRYITNYTKMPVNALINLKRPKRWYLSLMVMRTVASLILLGAPAYSSYLLYLAINFKQPVYFGLSWAIFSGVLLLMLGNNGRHGLKQKISKITLVPSMYGLFYLASLFRLFAFLAAYMAKPFRMLYVWNTKI